MDTTRKGKIARLPARIREQLNLRLFNGDGGPRILPWLNGLPEVAALLGEDFEGLAVNDQNLSDWRKGGYQDWLKRRDRIDHTRELAGWSMKLAKAGGGNLTEGAAAVLSGKVLEVLEGLDELMQIAPADGTAKNAESVTAIGAVIDGLTNSLARLRRGDHDAEQLRLNRERLAQNAEALKLDREKFVMLICGKLLDTAKLDKVREIAASDKSNADKIAELRREYFKDVDALDQSGDIQLPK